MDCSYDKDGFRVLLAGDGIDHMVDMDVSRPSDCVPPNRAKVFFPALVVFCWATGSSRFLFWIRWDGTKNTNAFITCIYTPGRAALRLCLPPDG